MIEEVDVRTVHIGSRPSANLCLRQYRGPRVWEVKPPRLIPPSLASTLFCLCFFHVNTFHTSPQARAIIFDLRFIL